MRIVFTWNMILHKINIYTIYGSHLKYEYFRLQIKFEKRTFYYISGQKINFLGQ